MAITEPAREPEVNKLFRMVMKHEGSDLHLKVGLPPMMRLRGLLRQMDLAALNQEQLERLLYPIMNQEQRETLDAMDGSDFTHMVGQDEGRFRVNVFKRPGGLALVARRVNLQRKVNWIR